MEIRILKEDELAYASGLSRLVFDSSLRNRMEFTQSIPFVENYIGENNLKTMYQEGRLTVWGAIEEGRLIGVGGIQSDGMITLLYVLPQYVQRGCGRKLIQTMKTYASQNLHLSNVTVNAAPAWTSMYFRKHGFVPIHENQNISVPFVPMQAAVGEFFVSGKQKIRFSTVIWAVIACISFATFVGMGFMISYLF